MMTFVPCLTMERCARVLDRQRLGDQRLEAQVIANAITGEFYGWFDHPVVRMWEAYLPALRQYQRAILLEWIGRGYKNNFVIPRRDPRVRIPDWWGGPIHANHRAVLLHRHPAHYRRYWPRQLPGGRYLWPC